MSVDSAVEPKPRLQKRGDQKKPAQLFTALHVKAFDTVLDYATTINGAIEAHSPVAISCSRLTPVDYLVTVQQAIAAADLNKGLLKNLKKLLRGEEIGIGSKNMLIARLGPLFVKPEFALFPRARFFVGTQAFRDEKNRRRVPKITKSVKPTEVLASIPSNGISYFDEVGRRISSESWRQASQQVIEAKQQKEAALIAAAERAATEQAMLDEPYYFEADAFERQNYGLELEETA